MFGATIVLNIFLMLNLSLGAKTKMFRKLVSSLPFSPALVGQLGFYIRRLRKEEVTRRLGLIFTVMAVVMQSFTVFTPPEQAFASSTSDVIPGGVTSVQQILNTYDSSTSDFKSLMNYMGITRSELASMSGEVKYICSSDKDWISFGRNHHYSAAEGELIHNVPNQTGGYSIFYSVPLYRFDSVNNRINCYDSYVGNSQAIGPFAIMRKCGNVQIKKNIQKFPKGHLIAANCQAVQGYAYDERQPSSQVKMYLFFGGPPGKGKQFGPINANQSTPSSPIGGSHGFSFTIPDEYKKSNTPTDIWANLVPLPGWNQATVQFDNTVQVPGNCVPTEQPFASCTNLDVIPISRTKAKLSVSATTNSQVKIIGYTFTVVDKSGKKVYEKRIDSNSANALSDVFDVINSGEYTAKVVVHTTIGDKASSDCETKFVVNPPEKCQYIGSGDTSKDDSNCKPCPYDKNLWVNDSNCVIKISQSKEARNMTKDITKANGTLASATDRIEYTIYTTNLGDSDITTSINESLTDVLEYARVIDTGGGTFDQQSKVLSWGDVKLGPQKTDTRHFIVQLSDIIPSTPRGSNSPAAYNCVITNSYGNTIEIKVDCPPVKEIEAAVKTLPSTGPGENIVFGTVLLMTVAYFYARSRQMSKEAHLIRKDYSTGAI